MNIKFKENILITILIVVFYEVFIKLGCIFNELKTIYMQLLWYCPTIYITYIWIIKIWWFFIFIIIFYVFVISFYISMNSMTYSTSNTFSTINNISVSINRSTFTLVFFKTAWHANHGVERKQDLVYIFQVTYFESSQIHQHIN